MTSSGRRRDGERLRNASWRGGGTNDLGIVLEPSLPHSPALHCPTPATWCVLLSAQAYRMLIGACDPMFCPNFVNWGFRPRWSTSWARWHCSVGTRAGASPWTMDAIPAACGRTPAVFMTLSHPQHRHPAQRLLVPVLYLCNARHCCCCFLGRGFPLLVPVLCYR